MHDGRADKIADVLSKEGYAVVEGLVDHGPDRRRTPPALRRLEVLTTPPCATYP